MEHEHSIQAIQARLSEGTSHNYLRDFIYGGIDGTVTTFAIVAGVVGAQLSPSVVLILGIANLIADGFSMAASNYLGTKAEHDDRERMKAIEQRHIQLVPEGERAEVREIYRDKGFSGEELERVVALITADRKRWIETMLTEEYGLPKQSRSAWLAACSTFGAFLLCGSVPLMPFLFGISGALTLATVLTGIVFFIIGSLKSRWSTESWWSSGLATFAIGTCAALLAYLVGVLLKGIAP